MTSGAEAKVFLSDEVVLDFGGLFSTAQDAPESPVEPRKNNVSIIQPVGSKAPLQGHTEAVEKPQEKVVPAPAISLLRDSQREAEDHRKTAEVYRTYQDNIKLSGELRNSILKGVRAGADTYSLFLQAAKAISLMTSDNLFYKQIEEDLIAIYGRGLGESKPLEAELNGASKRLEKLEEALKRETETDTRARITAAIRRHKELIEDLKERIEKTA